MKYQIRTYEFHVLSPFIKGATPSPLGAGVVSSLIRKVSESARAEGVTSLLPKTAVLPLLRENPVKRVSPTNF